MSQEHEPDADDQDARHELPRSPAGAAPCGGPWVQGGGFEQQRRAIASIDQIVNRLDALRVAQGLSKADVARAIDTNPASVRRLLTARGNPGLATVVAMADALDADVLVVSRESRPAP